VIFSNLTGGAGLVEAGAAGAGVGVVAAFGGAVAIAPETKATRVNRTTKRIIFFIQFHLLSLKIKDDIEQKKCQKIFWKNNFQLYGIIE
jgi:hypothetical protein